MSIDENMSEENDTGEDEEQSEETGSDAKTESKAGPDNGERRDDETADQEPVSHAPIQESWEKPADTPAIEADDDDILDAIKTQAKETNHDEKEPENSGTSVKESSEAADLGTDDDEILDAIKTQATESKQDENASDGLGAGVKEPSEMLAIEADEDEILDEIRPKSAETKHVDPEQYKKDFNKNQVEAVLFVSGQAVSPEEISVKLTIPKKQVEDMLEKLAMEYLERSTSLEIAKIADKYILQLKPEFTSHVKSFASGGLIREAVMRTLTIVAAKQPILQSDLSKIRSSAGEHLKELLDMGLIKKTPKGRSSELTTNDKFADMFGFSRDVAKMKEQIKIYLTAATKDDE
ncbi:MAG TPA: SMC-Scp complex subunit ScpB [Candidatus Lokiarchaeia archaeon]|nr:SMC-Scp complex subunit ScpB [Candidatus Lokiarchaeia archaeon]